MLRCYDVLMLRMPRETGDAMMLAMFADIDGAWRCYEIWWCLRYGSRCW
jgi:hypothetical protein